MMAFLGIPLSNWLRYICTMRARILHWSTDYDGDQPFCYFNSRADCLLFVLVNLPLEKSPHF